MLQQLASSNDVYDDSNPCTTDACQGTAPTHPVLVAGSSCPGGVCDGQGACVECLSNTSCISPLQCANGECVPPACLNALKDSGETDVDCGGGQCRRCTDGDGCVTGVDCNSGVCINSICQAPSCDDGVVNGSETDVDCGGGLCSSRACAPGKKCKAPKDCEGAVCKQGICQASSCTDGVTNGNETGVDCGGSCPPCLSP